MDRPTDELVQRLLAAVLDSFGSDEAIDQLVSRARDEAEAEVRELLKGAIKATLLQRAVSRLESDAGATAAVTPPPEAIAAAEPDAQAEAAEDMACYVYGITRVGSSDLPPDLPGVDPRAPLCFVGYNGLIAVTTEVSLAEFGAEASAERVKDLEWVEQKVRAHDQVVKAMLGAGPVIPCRFCTILRSADDVRRVLARNHAGLSETLDALDGRKEWGVKIYAARGVANSDLNFATGKSYFLEKKREQATRAESARALRAAAEACHDELSAAASDGARLRTLDAGGSGATREVLLNAAYLVGDADTDRFHALVKDLSRRYESRGLWIDLTGPWPPYNFVSLQLSPETPPGDAQSEDALAGPEAAA